MCEAAVGDEPVGGVRLASEERLRRVGEEVREREAQRDEAAEEAAARRPQPRRQAAERAALVGGAERGGEPLEGERGEARGGAEADVDGERGEAQPRGPRGGRQLWQFSASSPPHSNFFAAAT